MHQFCSFLITDFSFLFCELFSLPLINYSYLHCSFLSYTGILLIIKFLLFIIASPSIMAFSNNTIMSPSLSSSILLSCPHDPHWFRYYLYLYNFHSFFVTIYYRYQYHSHVIIKPHNFYINITLISLPTFIVNTINLNINITLISLTFHYQ